MPLGSEVLLQPFAGMSLPWLLGFPTSDVALGEPTRVGGIGVPVYGYVADPTQLAGDAPGFVLNPVDDGGRSVDGFTPSFVPPALLPPEDPHDPDDPRDPGDPGDPADPGDPGDSGNPFNPNFAPPENPVVPAPEPATLLLVGGGLAALTARRRRR